MPKRLKIIENYNNTEPMQFDEHFPEDSIGFKTQNTQLFKNLLHFIEAFLSELNFRINSEGIFITSMDSNHISLIDCFIPCELFGLYTCDEEIVRGFDFKAHNKILSHLNYDDELVMIFNEDTTEIREKYFNIIIDRFEKLNTQNVKNSIIFKESFCVNDFIKDYNSYKGNAYGMANTLLQTAFLRSKLKSKKVEKLYFTGQLTVPGPGVPPSLISGKLVAELIKNYE